MGLPIASVSVITPTIGRPSLAKMLSVILPQLTPADEVLVIGDGPTPAARKICESFANPIIKYDEHGPIWNFGNPQRNLGIERAKSQFVMFLDDDDNPIPGMLSLVKQKISAQPDRPHVFRINVPWGQIPHGHQVVAADISGQCIAAPNVKARLGKWSGLYGADFDFISRTLALYPPGSIVWHSEIICTVIQAGKGTIGHEIR